MSQAPAVEPWGLFEAPDEETDRHGKGPPRGLYAALLIHALKDAAGCGYVVPPAGVKRGRAPDSRDAWRADWMRRQREAARAEARDWFSGCYGVVSFEDALEALGIERQAGLIRAFAAALEAAGPRVAHLKDADARFPAAVEFARRALGLRSAPSWAREEGEE